MKGRILSMAAVFFVLLPLASACLAVTPLQENPLCKPLRAFVASIKAGEHQELQYRTSWGGDFKDAPGDGKNQVFAAKRCEFFGYAPGREVCSYLAEHGAIEFSENTAMDAIHCLSPGTTLGDGVHVHRIETSFSYGTDDRGSDLTIRFGQDDKVGGMLLDITADGY